MSDDLTARLCAAGLPACEEYTHALTSTYVDRGEPDVGRTYYLVDQDKSDAALAALLDELERAENERIEYVRLYERAEERIADLQETNSRLNRRCQAAESAVAEKIRDHHGKSLGRALANAGYAVEKDRADALEAKVAELLDELERVKGAGT